MKRYDRMAGLFLLAVGVAAAFYSVLVLKLGTLRRPDSGFMPFLAALVLIAFSGAWLSVSRGKDETPQPFWEKGEWRRPLLALLFLGLYGWLMSAVGYVTSTLLFMLLWQFLIEGAAWKRATLISVSATAGMYLLFDRMLHVPVPPDFFMR